MRLLKLFTEKVTDLLSPTKSFFTRIFFSLIPFAIVVSGLYTLLIASSVYTTEDHVLRDYLHGEYQRFAIQVEQEGKPISPPSTSYLHGYWQDDPKLPEDLRRYTAGYHELISEQPDQDRHLLVADIPNLKNRLYMVLMEQQFSSISQYEGVLGSILFTVAGLVIITSGILALIIARALAKPVSELAEDVSGKWQPEKQFRGFERNDEIGILSRSFTELTQELQFALDKEKSFTRHASHEMRTPLAVIRNALSVLKLPNCSPEKQQRNLHRIEQACTDAERMVDAFLCLGQERPSLINEHLSVSDLIKNALKNYEEVKNAKNLEISLNIADDITIMAPTSLLEVVVDNLLRNAINYGKDTLEIVLNDYSLIFTNRIGISSSDQNNYGYGLEIVRRICDQTGWKFTTVIDDQIFTARLQLLNTHEKG